MTVPQILLVLALVVVTGVVAWLLGRRSSPAPSVVAPASPDPKPVAISDPEIQLHERLAQAAAEMVVPLETYFSRGVELNLTTASLTKDLLEKLPAKEAQVLLVMQSGLDEAGLNKLSTESGFSLGEMETLRRKFQVSAAAALLPKIKAGLSTAPPSVTTQGLSPAPPSNLTERLTLSTESNEIAHLKKLLNDAREEKESLAKSHVPKTRLDSLQDEMIQYRKNEEHLAQTIAGLQKELGAAKGQIAAHPAQELQELRSRVQLQQTLASQLEATVAELQASLQAAKDDAGKAQGWQAQILQLQQNQQELESQVAARVDYISKAELTTLQQAWEQERAALERESRETSEQLEEVTQQRVALEASHAGAQDSIVATEEMENLRAQFERDLAAKKAELEKVSSEKESLVSELAGVRETHVGRGELAAVQALLSLANEEQRSLKDALASVEKTAADHASQRAALEEQLAGISDKYVERAEWEGLQSALQQAQEEHTQTRSQMQEGLEKVLEQVALKSRECEELDRKLTTAAQDAISPAELEAAKAQLHQAEEEKLQMRAELEAAQHLTEELQAAKASLAEQLAEMESTHRPVEEVESLRSQQAELNQRRIDLEAALEAERAALQEALSRHGALQSEHRSLSEQLAAAREEPPVAAVSESQEEMAVELKIARESQVRLVAELEALKESYAAIPTDQHEVAQRLAVAEQEAVKSQEESKAAQAAGEAAQKLQKETEAEMLNLRAASIPRGDYEALRLEADKARQDLSTALGRYATLQRRFDSVDKAASIERLKANLSQEEKAHGVLRIQYRNLESRLYEAVGARKRVETDIKTIAKERDEIASKLKSLEKSAPARVKVILPPEVANPPLDGEITPDEPTPKRRTPRKKPQETVEESTETVPVPEPEI